MKELEKIRKKIDKIDNEMLNLLNERSNLVLDVGNIKRKAEGKGFGKIKFYSPQREKKIIERLKKRSEGPFPKEALATVFREIFSASLSLEEPLKVACLGPLATFTHLAAMRHFGSSASFKPVDSIRGVFDAVDRGDAEFGIVPIENSNEGVVSYTLDMFVDYDLKVAAEVMLEVSHNLISRSGKRSKVKRIYTHPQAIAQCKGWLEANMSEVPTLETTSTARAAELAAKDDTAAAIASEAAARLYELKVIRKHIEDRRHNFTRFLVIAEESPPETGHDKTSIMFSIKDKPGALYNILSPFKRSKINLTKIESRPSKRKAWEYIFFVDMGGHMNDARIKRAIENVKKECLFLKVLGSYPCGE